MDENGLKKYTVILGSGSGVLFQPLDETKTYVLSAKHVFYDIIKNDNGPDTKTIKDKISLSLSTAQDKKDEIEIINGTNYFEHSSDEVDASILILDKHLGFNQIFVDEDSIAFNDYFLCGYDNNTKRVQDAINTLRNNVSNSSYSQTVKNNCISSFNEKCVAVLNANNYDYTNSKTTEIINWLSNSMDSFINYYLQQEKQSALIEEQKRRDLTSQIANEMNYNVGGFNTNDVTEEKYNPYTKTYEIVSKDNSLTKVYFDIGYLHYFRQAYNGWRFYTWRYSHAADNYHIITDVNTGTQIEIGKLFDWIIFSEQKVGDVYTRRYIYRNLKKDKTVLPTY